MVATRLLKKNATTGKPTRSYQNVAYQFPWVGTSGIVAPGSSNFPFVVTCNDSTHNGGPYGSAYWILGAQAGPDTVDSGLVVGQSTQLAAAPGFVLRVVDSTTITFAIAGTPGSWTMPVAVTDNQLTFTDTAPETNPGTGLYSVTIAASGDVKYGTWGSSGTFGSWGDPLSFTRVGNDLLIVLATDGGGTITSTASDVLAGWPYTSDVAATCSGTGATLMNNSNPQEWLLGAFSASFTLTADDLDWSVQYNNFYPLPDRTGATQSRGYVWMVKVKKVAAGSAYAEIGDGFSPQYPPSDDSGMMDFTTALTLAQTIYPAAATWEFSTGTHAAIEGGATFPTTIKAGVPFSGSITFVDPRPDGLSLAGDTFRDLSILPFPPSGIFFDPPSNPSDGVWGFTNCQIYDVGGYEFTASTVFSAPVTPPRTLYFGHIKVTPGDPNQLVLGDAFATPFSAGPVQALGGARLPIRGQRVDGSIDAYVGTTQAFSVQVQDSWGNVCTDATPIAVTVSVVDTGSPAIAPVLSGTTTVMTVAGVASFGDLRVTGLTKTAKLHFTAPGLTALDAALSVQVFGLVTAPGSATVGDDVTITYQLADWDLSALAPPLPDPVTVGDGPLAGSFAPSSPTVTPDASGLATFTGSFPAPGTFDLHLASSGAKYLDPGKRSPRITVSAP